MNVSNAHQITHSLSCVKVRYPAEIIINYFVSLSVDVQRFFYIMTFE